MNPVVTALIPIFGVIALGWGLRRSGMVAAELWAGVNRLSYQALLPALLFSTISRADYGGLPAGTFLIAVTLGFLVMGLIALAFRPLPIDGPAYRARYAGTASCCWRCPSRCSGRRARRWLPWSSRRPCR